MIFSVLLGAFVIIILALNSHLLRYWTKRGFKQPETTFFFGNGAPLFTLQKTIGVFMEDLYNKYKDQRIFGIYLFYQPNILVTDPKIVQDIMIRDFTSFHDRPMPVDEKNDPLSGHLFSLGGQQWRDMRVKLSPTFTSGKLKGMFSTIKDVTKVLEDYLVKNVKQGTEVFEFRDLMARFFIQIISSVAFGIENDCINEPNNIFRKMGASFFVPTFKNGLKGVFMFLMPKWLYKVNLRVVERDFEDFIISIVKQTVDFREKTNFTRPDFMQLMIQLKNQGYVQVDKGEKEIEVNRIGDSIKLSVDQLAAQVFVFFVAGFETSSSTLSFCLFELARNPRIQKKIQEEVDQVLNKGGPDGFTYDLLTELKYTESCIDETLRKYPVVPFILRTASKDYKVSDSDLIIPEGTSVFIPVLGFHRDPEIYDNPTEFRPERFTDSSNGGGNSKGVFYMPFGDGPRNCIGMRLGKLMTKIGLALILSKFNLELADKEMNEGELEFDPKQFVLAPKKLFNIKITQR